MKGNNVKHSSSVAVVNKMKNNNKSNGCHEASPTAVRYKRKDKDMVRNARKVCKSKNNQNDSEAVCKQDQLLKRRHENRQLAKEETGCKRYEFSRNVTNSSIIESASVSPSVTKSLCRFACSDCSSTFKTWQSLRAHRKKVHDKSTNQHDVEAYMFKASVHVCLICSKKVLCDSYFLSAHIIINHKMPVSKYRQQYNCNSVDDILKTKLAEKMKTAKHTENVIGNFCTFRCPGCKKTFYSMTAFLGHCNPNVGKKCQQLVKDTIEWRACIELVATHKCKLCFKLLLCDISTITKHSRRFHNTKTIQEYAKKSGCTFQKYSNNPDKVENVNSENAKTSVQVGNNCTFTCHDCGHISECWAHMRKHLRESNHGSSNNAWQHYITETVLHQCKICKKKVLNDSEFISKHINPNHHMSIATYKLLKT